MKRFVLHTVQCKQKVIGGCQICEQYIALCHLHAEVCNNTKCSVSFCESIKLKLWRQQIQHEHEEKQKRDTQEKANLCFVCQDFKANVQHETKWCPSLPCKKCNQNGHTKLDCMIGMENKFSRKFEEEKKLEEEKTRLKAECFSLNGHKKGSPERVLRKAPQKGYSKRLPQKD